MKDFVVRFDLRRGCKEENKKDYCIKVNWMNEDKPYEYYFIQSSGDTIGKVLADFDAYLHKDDKPNTYARLDPEHAFEAWTAYEDSIVFMLNMTDNKVLIDKDLEPWQRAVC